MVMTPEELYQRIIAIESAGRPRAVSRKGAQGLMQIMPATARDPGYGIEPLPEGADLFDPEINRDFGTRYLEGLRGAFGSYPAALAAYNWGPGNMRGWSGLAEDMPAETRDYLERIYDQPFQEIDFRPAPPIPRAKPGGGAAPARALAPIRRVRPEISEAGVMGPEGRMETPLPAAGHRAAGLGTLQTTQATPASPEPLSGHERWLRRNLNNRFISEPERSNMSAQLRGLAPQPFQGPDMDWLRRLFS